MSGPQALAPTVVLLLPLPHPPSLFHYPTRLKVVLLAAAVLLEVLVSLLLVVLLAAAVQLSPLTVRRAKQKWFEFPLASAASHGECGLSQK